MTSTHLTRPTPHRSRGARVGAALAALALPVAGLAATAAPAQADLPPGQATGAAAWQLARQLGLGGNHLSATFSGTAYPDYGSTIDSVLALDGAGTGQTQAVRSARYLARHVADYTGSGTERYAGPTAKALLMAQAQLVKPLGYLGGRNLRGALRALESTNGRFSDRSQFGDYSNTFGQSLAIVALRRVAVPPSPASVRYLFTQQCPGGGFREAEADTQCDTADASVDATALAVQALVAVPQGSEARQRLADAMTYLTSAQQSNGGFSAGNLGENTNTTGLAALALTTGGETTAASRARSFLSSLSYDCTSPYGLRGLVAYTQATYAGTGRSVEQELKATSQALQGLAAVPYLEVSRVGAGSTAPYPC